MSSPTWEKLIAVMMGRVMAATGGRANPQVARKVILDYFRKFLTDHGCDDLIER